MLSDFYKDTKTVRIRVGLQYQYQPHESENKCFDVNHPRYVNLLYYCYGTYENIAEC